MNPPPNPQPKHAGRGSWLSAFVIVLAWLAPGVAAKSETFDGGVFAITIDVDPENWRIQSNPKLNLIQFQKAGGVGLGSGTAFEAYVYGDRFDQAAPLTDHEKEFLSYLKMKQGFLRTKVFEGARRFRPAKSNPITIGEKTLLRFDMAKEPLTSLASNVTVEEEGVVYFLLLPGFEQHKMFFVFAGRQVISRDRGHRSELHQVEALIKGFALTLKQED